MRTAWVSAAAEHGVKSTPMTIDRGQLIWSPP
jgi:hypothetical protein